MRAGPALPSYLALLHAGFSVPRMSPSGRWALTPPFHPCQMRSTQTGQPPVFPRTCHRSASGTGGLIFCGTFRSRVSESRLRVSQMRNPLALPGALPFVDGSCEFTTMESGLSSRPPLLRAANQRSPGSPAKCDYSRSARGSRGCVWTIPYPEGYKR
jgi:hypothetical protein